jgi:hypothetical protein
MWEECELNLWDLIGSLESDKTHTLARQLTVYCRRVKNEDEGNVRLASRDMLT